MSSLFTPEIVWSKPLHPIGPDDNPNARLFGTVEILNRSFHVNCEQVHEVQHPGVDPSTMKELAKVTTQETVIDESDTYAPNIWEMADGACETVTIDGREYLLVISPYQR